MRFLKLFIFFSCVLLSSKSLLGQDTLAYEIQRQRVNSLLDQRSVRFGEFTKSLEARTGIFGFKTKKDMQASIDILKEIVVTDNHIFKETKILLDYKDMEKTFITYQAEESIARINGYVNTISKQQKNQEELMLQNKKLQQDSDRYLIFFLLSFLLLIVLAFSFVKLRLRNKTTRIS